MIIAFKVLVIILVLIGCPVQCQYDDQPKISNENGTLVIESAIDRNISVWYSGRSAIMVGEVNFGNALQDAQLKQEVASMSTDSSALTLFIDTLQSEITIPSGIGNRLKDLENITRDIDRMKHSRFAHLRRRMDNLGRRIMTLQTKLREDNCRDMPCKNGGTCYDLYDDFFCECPDEWKGRACEEDFDECIFFAGTGLGCENNARCVNKAGSYSCECTAGWVGRHCTKRITDCQSSPSMEMCGHGICVPVSNETGYRCICEQGWTRDNTSMACTSDINECDGRNPCHTQCINLPGSYMCGPCPPGYSGNGWTCADVNECVTNNGGCSTKPVVRCYNTEGSFRCGSCPPGYIGDGMTCTRFDSNTCSQNNVCHPLAECFRLSHTVACICPHDMIGDGIGLNGCRKRTDPCENNSCMNGGTCLANGTSYSCICPPGYLPPICAGSQPLHVCDPNPCLNGGTCLKKGFFMFTCHCPPGFFGGNCNYDSSMCSGTIEETVGFLNFPGNNNTYYHNDACVWVIKTFNEHIINLTFVTFDLEYSQGCVHDWLQIHDGQRSSSPLIGRFCGADKPKGGTVISTQNYLYLWFRSDNSSSHRGFEAHWNTLTPTCGGMLRAKNAGVIASPGYPAKTPPGTKCNWRLIAPPGQRIQLIFYSFEANGKADNCSEEHLTVLSGRMESWTPVLAKYCDKTIPDPLLSPSREIDILFETDMSERDAAFQLHYSTVPSIPDCGGSFISLSGTIRSPTIDGTYPNDIICEYIIKLPLFYLIKLEFSKFSLVESTSCLEDYVEIYDGNTEEHPLIGRWCGQNRPENVTSSSTTLFVKFRSDFLIGDEGFIARYTFGCGSFHNSDTGIIKSPNYPDQYPPNMDCVYKIEAQVGYVVNVTSIDFLLEYSPHDWVTDYVEIYDGHFSPENSLGRFSDRYFPSQTISSYNFLEIRFHSDYSQQFRGFYFSYDFINVGCGGVLKDLNGTFNSPNANDALQTGLNGTCTWILDLPPKYSTFIMFPSFNIDDNPPACKANFLEVTYNTPRGQKIQRFCGAENPSPNTYNGRVKITYRSDFGFSSNAFEAFYEGINTEHHCGGNYTSLAGSLQSPGYPNDYPPGLQCIWTIVAPLVNQIELVINKFELEMNCEADYLEIRDGKTATSPIIGTYCGYKIPPLISSFTNALYIKFVSDMVLESKGFDIEFQQTSTGCGGILESYRGSIASPNFPEFPMEVMQCDWKVIINQGSNILMTVKYFDHEGDSLKCEERNYIRIYDVYPGTPFKRNCTTGAIEDTFVTSSNTALVRFVSNGTLTGVFHLNYTANCDNELRKSRGVIESPNYPNDYPNNMRCEWKIIAKVGTKIHVAFSHFNIENSEFDACSSDRVEIAKIKNNATVERVRHCKRKPQPFTTEDNTVLIKLISDVSGGKSGFRLEYNIEGCDATLVNDGATTSIASPGRPAMTRNKDCEYYLIVDYGKLVELTIGEVALPHRIVDCSRNGIVIADGYNTSNILAEICQPGIMFSKYTSTTNKMYVHFIADSSVSGKKFDGFFTSKDAKCGGKIKARDGYILSPNYPQKYDSNSLCIWQVEVERQHTMNITFIDLDLDSSDCIKIERKDNLENPIFIYRGGNSFPTENVKTETHMAIVRFTSLNCEYRGFSAGTIEKKANRNNCIWYLSTEPTRVLRLNFGSVQCGCSVKTNSSNCENDKGIFVYDGDSTDAPLKVSFCRRHPPLITTSGPSATIKATTGTFRLHYSTFAYSCGSHLSSLHGAFASPHYPNSYPADTVCTWTIKAPHGNSILLHFEEFDVIADGPNCQGGFVRIWGGGAESRRFGTFCGNQLPPDIKAGNELNVKFLSRSEIGKGFYAEYSVAHENLITGQGGIIQSPPWDFMHDEDTDYTWRIYVDRPNVILLSFRHYSEGLKVYDGYDDTAPEIETGINIRQATSTTNYVCLKADHTISDYFDVVWHPVPKNISETVDECGNSIILVGSSATITSPGYPENYADNLNCKWIIKSVDPTKRITIIFRTIDMEQTANCLADYISISRSSDLESWDNEVKVCKMDDIATYIGSPYVKINFVSDSSIHHQGFLARIGTICGGSLTAPLGFIEMKEPADLDTGDCSWKIRVSSNRKIKFQFLQRHNVTHVAGSCTNYISIRDGYDLTSPFLGIGKYCTNHTDDIPLTTSNRAVVRFVETEYIPIKGWLLQYHEAREYCGESIQLTRYLPQAVIITPNFPNIPKPYSECIWTVVAPAGESINIAIVELSLRKKRFCDEESLRIYDGATTIAPELKNYCGVHQNESISTSNNAAFFMYSSNIPIPSHGFKLLVSLNKCGAKHTEDRGTITSENYPILGAYPRRSICEYLIDIPDGNINITFNDIDLPVVKNVAQSDYISFGYNRERSENRREFTEILRVYGNDTIRSRLFPGHSLVVRFVTFDINASYRGFKITYSVERPWPCNTEIRAERGEITTPFYPNRPVLHFECAWRITVPKGQRVTVKFDDFAFDAQHPIVDTWKMAKFYFYNDFRETSEIAVVTRDPGTAIYSSSNHMFIKFEYNEESDFVRAKLNFSSDQETVCSTDLSPSSGIILPPKSYMGSYYCEYEFNSNPNETLTFTITDVLIKGNITRCPQDSPIQVIERERTEFSVCSNATILSYSTVFSNHLRAFRPKAIDDVSFVINYKRHQCGGLMNSLVELSNIAKPSLSLDYGQVNCIWTYRTSSVRYLMNLTITTNFSSDCEGEYIRIRSGGHTHFETVCGNSLQNFTLNTFGSLEYHSDSYMLDSSFYVNAQLHSTCGSINQDRDSLLQLRRHEYVNNAHCEWYVITRDTKSFMVKLEFIGRFFIEPSPNCTKDYLEIRNEDNPGTDLLAKLCGTETPAPIYTRGRLIKLIFRSNNDTIGEGFVIRVTRICSVSFNATSEWQNFTHSAGVTDRLLECTYNIIAPSNKWIHIKFNKLEVADLARCESVEVILIKPEHAATNLSFCSLERVSELESLGGATIIFHSRVSLPKPKFEFSFRTVECGGIVNESTMISSPKIKDQYLGNTYCIWNITAGSGKVIRIEFLNFMLEPSTNCQMDYFRVFEGTEINETNRKANLCGYLSDRLPTIRLNSNAAIIEAGTDATVSHDGFKAIVSLVENCDSNVLLAPPNSSYLLNRFMGSYKNNLDCHYTFSTLSGYQLETSINQFDIKPCNDSSPICLCDYLEFSDAINHLGGLNGRVCGNQTLSTFSTFSNKLYVRFVTDSSVTGGGFNATITAKPSVCGESLRVIAPDRPVTIELPTINTTYPSHLKCFWHLTSGGLYGIHWDWERFDLPPPSEDGACSSYLEMAVNAELPVDELTRTEGYRTLSVQWSAAQSTFKFCGNSTPSDFLVDTSSVTLKFFSNEFYEGMGFKLVAKSITECKKNITTLSGKFFVSEAQRCEFNIDIPENYTIALHFINHLGIDFGDCLTEFTEIYDKNTNKMIETVCDEPQLTKHVFLNTNRVRIENSKGSQRSTEITYIASSPDQGIGCGGEFYGARGILSSPLYPSNTRSHTLCKWKVQAPERSRVRISFQVFEIGSRALCDSNYLQVVEVVGPGRNVTTKFCGEDNVGHFDTTGNIFSIIYKTAANFDGIGWVISLDAMYA